MKKLFTAGLFILYSFYIHAQQTGTTPPVTPATPVTPASGHDHDHDHGHDHDHDHDHDHEGETATPPVVNPNAPKLIFSEEVYSFGEIPEGPQVTHEFKFMNTGKEPLILSNVRASCGCTTPSWTKEPVLPGKEGSILVTYNTQGRPGVFSKTITITSNADESNKVISINGNVLKPEPEKSVPLEQPSMLSPH